MSHKVLYDKAFSNLENPDVNILEFTCMLYIGNYDKIKAYEYLKKLRLIPRKIAVVLNLLACAYDNEHPVMPDYADYAEAIRNSIRDLSLAGK